MTMKERIEKYEVLKTLQNYIQNTNPTLEIIDIENDRILVKDCSVPDTTIQWREVSQLIYSNDQVLV
jgi:hypothetical protein